MTNKFGILSATFGFVGILFLLSLKTFFTNDDFFLLKISRVTSPMDFVGFFNPFLGPDGLGMYRPLTTQVYYSLSRNLFASQPEILRVVSFIGLGFVGVLVYKLAGRITGSVKVSSYSVFFYLVSATHYAHLMYSATFQEIGLTIFVLLGVLSLWTIPALSLLYFIAALLCKETAIVYPLLIILAYFFYSQKSKKLTLRQIIFLAISYGVVLAVYAYFRFVYYGFASGDSYVWVLSPQILNTAGWYFLWSLNLPEMWVDFIGPGLKVNPNLIRFWGRESLAILLLFLSLILSLLKTISKSSIKFIIFSLLWFLISLGPLLLLPWHKFTFYLTLPLVGLAIFFGTQVNQISKVHQKIIIISWFLLSFSTLDLTIKTNWISNGAGTASRLHAYLNQHQTDLGEKSLLFYDQSTDASLPWSPSQVLKTSLSGSNYFQVYWPAVSAVYQSQKPATISPDTIYLPARQFLGY